MLRGAMYYAVLAVDDEGRAKIINGRTGPHAPHDRYCGIVMLEGFAAGERMALGRHRAYDDHRAYDETEDEAR
jgi:hypothetical protein